MRNLAFGGPLDGFVSADFDGAAKTDFAVYGPYGPGLLNRLAVIKSGGGTINIPYGGRLDKFVAADFDGDGTVESRAEELDGLVESKASVKAVTVDGVVRELDGHTW